MKILFIFTLIFFHFNSSEAGIVSQELKQIFEERGKFIQNYISIIKENKKNDKKFKGSVVEAASGRLFTRYGPFSQSELDKIALDDCKEAGELDCLVRFRTLSKNLKYNRYAKYDSSKKHLKVLGEYIKSKKINSTKGIDILVSEEEFRNQRNFYCGKTKSNYQETLDYLKNAIRVYPFSFIKNSGLKYVMVCEKITSEELGFEPAGLAPGHVDQSPGVFYINLSTYNKIKDPKIKKKEVETVFHHELYHIIDSSLFIRNIDEKWEEINVVPYAESPVLGSNGIDTSTKGFISQYARSNSREDKAELFAFMIAEHKKFKEAVAGDEILLKKLQLMISRLKKVSPEINKKFWARVEKGIAY